MGGTQQLISPKVRRCDLVKPERDEDPGVNGFQQKTTKVVQGRQTELTLEPKFLFPIPFHDLR